MTELALNKAANFNYKITETFEAGLVLRGYEVKALRLHQASLKEAFVSIRLHPRTKKPQAYLVNCHIPRYKPAGPLLDYDPTQSRRLLLHDREIASLYGFSGQKGLTIVPLRLYTRGTKIKVAIGVGIGKKQFDKKEVLKQRDVDRDVRRQLSARG